MSNKNTVDQKVDHYNVNNLGFSKGGIDIVNVTREVVGACDTSKSRNGVDRFGS